MPTSEESDMTQQDVSNLAKQAAEADAALRAAEATAKALKAQLKAERPSQMNIVRRAVIENEAITVDDLMAELATRGYQNAQKGIIQGLRSDAVSFLRSTVTWAGWLRRRSRKQPSGHSR